MIRESFARKSHKYLKSLRSTPVGNSTREVAQSVTQDGFVTSVASVTEGLSHALNSAT